MADVAVFSLEVVAASHSAALFNGQFEVSSFSVGLNQPVVCTVPCFYGDSKLTLKTEVRQRSLIWESSRECAFEVSIGELLSLQQAKMRKLDFEVLRQVKPVFADPSSIPDDFRGFVPPKKCPHCEAWFTKIDIYKRHLSSHFGGVPFMCRLSDMSKGRPSPRELSHVDRLDELSEFGRVRTTLVSTCGRATAVIEFWIVGYMYLALRLRHSRWNLFHAMVLHGLPELIREMDALLKSERENLPIIAQLLATPNCDGYRPVDLALTLQNGQELVKALEELRRYHMLPPLEPNILSLAVMSDTVDTYTYARHLLSAERYHEDVTRRDPKTGLTMLGWACSLGCLSIVKDLLSLCYVRRNAPSMPNQSNFAVFSHLQDSASDAILPSSLRELSGGRTSTGDTLLTLALKGGHEAVAWHLLLVLPPSTLEPGAMNEDHMTALMYACEAGYERIVKFLLRTDCGALQRPTDGRTVLHMAAANMHVEIVNLLIAQHGAWLVAYPDFAGATPYDLVQAAPAATAAVRAQLLATLAPQAPKDAPVPQPALKHSSSDGSVSLDQLESGEVSFRDDNSALETKTEDSVVQAANQDAERKVSGTNFEDFALLGAGGQPSVQDLAMAARNAIALEVASTLNVPVVIATAMLDHCGWRAAECVVEHTNDPAASFVRIGAEAGAANGFEWEPLGSVECPICYTEVAADEATRLETCGHAMCNECWSVALAVGVKELGPHCLSRRKCPVCARGAVTATVWERCASSEVLQKYEQYAAANFLKSQDRIVQCPNSKCKKYIFATDTMEACHCECGASFCAKCLRDCHAPLRCDESELWATLNQSRSEVLSFELLMTNYKRCPRCKMFIEKNEGCNHMTCRTTSGGCGYEFCWVCGGPHPCRGGCQAVAPVQWNTEHSAAPPPTANQKLNPTQELTDIWKTTFDCANRYEVQISDLQFMLTIIDGCQKKRPQSNLLWQSLRSAMECGVDMLRLMKNTEIRCYFLCEVVHSKRARSSVRKRLDGRARALRELVQGLRQQLDHVVVAISAFARMERERFPADLYNLHEAPADDVAFLDSRVAAASNFLQLAMHAVLQEEAVDPAPKVEETKVDINLDDLDMQYIMAKRIVSRAR